MRLERPKKYFGEKKLPESSETKRIIYAPVAIESRNDGLSGWRKRNAKDPEALGVCLMRKQSSREQENEERTYGGRRAPITTQSGETKVSYWCQWEQSKPTAKGLFSETDEITTTEPATEPPAHCKKYNWKVLCAALCAYSLCNFIAALSGLGQSARHRCASIVHWIRQCH